MAFLAVSGVRVCNDQSPTIPNSSNLTVQCRGVLLSVLVKQGLPAAALRTATAWWSLSAFRESGRGIALLQGGRAREIMRPSEDGGELSWWWKSRRFSSRGSIFHDFIRLAQGLAMYVISPSPCHPLRLPTICWFGDLVKSYHRRGRGMVVESY